MARLYITVGIPGCGKSTLSAKLGIPVVSSDAIREELLGDANDQSNGNLIFAEVYKRVTEHLTNGQDVVLDAVNQSKKSRRRTLSNFTKIPHETTALFFNTSPEICIERNACRERYVPEDVIWRFFRTMSEPTLDEGFDEVVEIISVERREK